METMNLTARMSTGFNPERLPAPGPHPAPVSGMRQGQGNTVSILIVTYNSATLIDGLLKGLRADLDASRSEVIVVDNASHDDTAQLISDRHPWVKLIESPQNLGFAAANNLGAQYAEGDFLLLLNPDAVPCAGAIEQGLRLMRQHPQVALAGGRLTDEQGGDQPSARMFPNFFRELFTLSGLAAKFPSSKWLGGLDRTWAQPDEAALVDWVPGAFALVRREVFEQLGGFDERFFMYYEEVDLCRRIHAMGMRVAYWPDLLVRHIGGASARTVEGLEVSSSGSQLTLWRVRSGLLYYRKNHGLLVTALVHGLERAWHAVRAARARWKGQDSKAASSLSHLALLKRAWLETMGGRVTPPRPW